MADDHDRRAEHEHGTMDVSEQERTFAGFMTFTMRAVLAIVVILVLLAMFRI